MTGLKLKENLADILSFTHKNKSVSRDDVKYGLKMKESSGGVNVKDRYEPKFHQELIRKKAIQDKTSKDKWFPTRAERRVIKERGEEKALKDFSTSKGEYQIMPETAYRYTSFVGNPEDLEDPEVAEKITDELLDKFHKEEGGDLEKSIHRWNQGGDYFKGFKEFLNDKGLNLGMLNPFATNAEAADIPMLELSGDASFLDQYLEEPEVLPQEVAPLNLSGDASFLDQYLGEEQEVAPQEVAPLNLSGDESFLDQYLTEEPAVERQTVADPEKPKYWDHVEKELGENFGRIGGSLERIGKGFGTGVAGMVEGMGGVAKWFGVDNVGDGINNYAKEMKEFYEVPDPDFVTAVAAGFGSMATFLIPGLGVSKGVQAISAMPRLAAWLGASASAVMESSVEAGGAYNRSVEKGEDHEGASSAATKVFWLNLPLIVFTNKLGIFGENGGLILKGITSSASEAVQEFSQQLIGNFATKDPLFAGALESAAVGAIVGGGTGAVLSFAETIDAKKKDAKAKEEKGEVEADIEQQEKEMPGVNIEEAEETVEVAADTIPTEEQLNTIFKNAEGKTVKFGLKIGEDKLAIETDDIEVLKQGIAKFKDKISKPAEKPAEAQVEKVEPLVEEEAKVQPEPIPQGKEGIVEADLTTEARKYATAEEFVEGQEPSGGINLKEILGDISDALGGKEGSSEISPEGKSRKEEAEKRILTKHLPALKAEAQRLGMTLKAYLKKFTEFTSEQINYLTGLSVVPPETVIAEEGEEKVRGLSKSIAGQAIKAGLIEEFGDLPTYKTRNMKDVADRAIAFIEKDYDLAMSIALGEAEERENLRASELNTAIRIKATAEGDIDAIQKLAFSETAVSAATEAGQRVQAYDAQISFDPVKTIQKIVKERAEVVKEKPAAKKEIDEYKQKLEETEAKIKELEAKIAESRGKEKKGGFGSKNKIFTQARVDAARTSLRAKLGGLHSGVDPTAVVELTEIGGFYFEGGVREFGAWSDMLVKEFGDVIKPHLGKIWKDVKKEYSKGQIENTKEKIGQLAAEDDADISFMVQKLAESLVSSGVVSRNNLVREVQSILQESYPDITFRETADLISGYGKYKRLSQEQAKQILRDIKGQLQQISKLEDMQQGQSPLKTGVERREVSDEERSLIKLVEEAKKKYNIQTTDMATQLKSALDGYKTKLRNQIKDLEKQIKERKKTIKTKTPLRLDAEASALMDRKIELTVAYTAIFGKQGLSVEQRISMAEKSLERSIAAYEDKIGRGDVSPVTKTKTPVSTANIEKLRTRRDVLKKQLQSIRDLAKPKKTAQEVALQSLKTRLTNETARIEDRLDALDFEVKAKREIALDAEAQKLRQKRDQIKSAYNAAKHAKEGITKEEVVKIVDLSKAAADAQKKVTDKDDWTADNAKEVEDYFDKRNKLEEYAEGLRPKTTGDIVNKFFDYFRASILASPRILRNSFLYQVVPGIERAITKRIVTGAFSDADLKSNIAEKLLAKLSGIKPSGKSMDFIKRQTAMAARIYHNTGIDISRLDKMDSTPKFFGERVGKFIGKGLIGKYAKFVSLAPKWFAGGTDMLFASIGRADTSIMMAKEIAKIEALQGKLPDGMTQIQRADQLLKDSYSFNPKDKRAATIRDAGIMDAHMMNNTQPGWYSDKVIEFRRMFSVGKINFGKVIVPFAKIASVVAAEGVKTGTGYGIAKSLYDINVASRKANTNDRAKLMRSAVTDLVRYTGLMGAAMLLASFLDDDDYIGAYHAIGKKDYEMARARNAGTNNIRIAGRWIPLRYLPMLNIPISAIMTARQAKKRGKSVVSGYLIGVMGQILDTPGITETGNIMSRVGYAMRADNMEKMAKSMGMDWDGLNNWAKVRMIPSVLSYDVWNALFPKDSKYDFMGNEIERGVFKEDKSNDITLEFNRLAANGHFPTITKPTGKYAVLLKERLGEEEYTKMLSGFQQKYAKRVGDKIKTERYKNSSNEDKKKSINKIRSEEISDKLNLKEGEFLKENNEPITKTRKEFERSAYRKSLKGKIRKGENIDVGTALKMLGKEDFNRAKKEARMPPFADSFNRMSLGDALDVYGKSSAEERRQVKSILRGKYSRAKAWTKTPELRKYYFDLMKK